MRIIKYMATVVVAAMAISSCDEDTMTIGQSLTNSSDRLDIKSESFDVYTRTIIADSVFATAGNCYLGQVKDPETGANVKSGFTTQFHILENTYISPEDRIVGRYDGRAAADSCQLIMYLSSPFRSSDSLCAIKMTMEELDKPLSDGMRYYSNYDPVAHGLIREGGLKKSKMFTYRNTTDTDSARASSNYMENISISLNQPYTDKQGNTYNNYGTYLMHQYFDHPENYRNSYTFIHKVCPGFFFDITDGLGFHAQVTDIGLRTFYTVKTDSTNLHAALTLAGTSEVLQTTYVKNDADAIRAMAEETHYTYLKTPAGLFTEVTIPVEDIKSTHENDSLIAAEIVFQRLNNQSFDSRILDIPKTLLMVQKDSLYSYFEESRVPDSKTSYYAVFNSKANTYSFNNISNLITELWRIRKEGQQQNPNWTAEHPDWNKVVLVPITYSKSSSSSSLTGVQHDMSLTSTRLVGGPDNANSPVRLSIIYANFTNQ